MSWNNSNNNTPPPGKPPFPPRGPPPRGRNEPQDMGGFGGGGGGEEEGEISGSLQQQQQQHNHTTPQQQQQQPPMSPRGGGYGPGRGGGGGGGGPPGSGPRRGGWRGRGGGGFGRGGRGNVPRHGSFTGGGGGGGGPNNIPPPLNKQQARSQSFAGFPINNRPPPPPQQQNAAAARPTDPRFRGGMGGGGMNEPSPSSAALPPSQQQQQLPPPPPPPPSLGRNMSSNFNKNNNEQHIAGGPPRLPFRDGPVDGGGSPYSPGPPPFRSTSGGPLMPPHPQDSGGPPPPPPPPNQNAGGAPFHHHPPQQHRGGGGGGGEVGGGGSGSNISFRPDFAGSDNTNNMPPQRRGGRRGGGGSEFRGRGGGGRGGGPPPPQLDNNNSYYGPPSGDFRRSPTRGRLTFVGRGGGGGNLPPPPLSRTGSFRRNDPRFSKDGPPPPPDHHHHQQHHHDGGGSMDDQQHHHHQQSNTPFGHRRGPPSSLPQNKRGGPSSSTPSGGEPGDAFGRTREWGSASTRSSPHASPVQSRKAGLKFFQEHPSPSRSPQQQHQHQKQNSSLAPAVAAAAAASAATTSAAASEKEKTATAAEPPPPVVEEVPPPPLLTTALGEAHSDRAEVVVGHVCGLLGDASNLKAPEGQVSTLPTKQQIFTAMAKMDIKIKQAQKELEEKKQAVTEAVKDDEGRRKQAKQDAIAEAKQQEEERLRQEETRLAEEEKAHESEIQSFVEKQKSVFESEQEKAESELQAKLKVATEEEEKKLREALNEQMITTADNFDKDIVKVRKELDRATQIAKKTENRLATVEKDYRAKVEKAEKTGAATEEAPKSHDLISTILAENRRRAAEAHMSQSLYVTLDEEDDATNNETVVALANAKDPKEGKTSAEWSLMSRNITGLKDAFYSEPCETPFWEQNEQTHKAIAPLVKEYIRDKHNRLTQHWTDLAEEYEYRRVLHEKRMQSEHAHAKERPRKSVSIPVRHSILETGKPNNPILESGGGRSSNPYRRARRGNEVRSEYEQEQIIAEIAAKEALEKRITFGKSDLPRQIGRLEKELNGTFVNTFTSQKVDMMEQERQLANSNVWTDMEKAIFLDRWLQFPKDFRKIASFLRSKTTQDCVRFYYDSKQSIPYKGALREHIMRRKRRGDYQVWDATIEAALSVGATIEAGPNEDKPLIFYLPEDDHTYATRDFHPLKRRIFDMMTIDEEASLANCDEDEFDEQKRSGRSKKRTREPLFDLDASQKKYLKSQKDTPMRKTQSRSSMADTDSSMTDEAPASSRKPATKWTAPEKKLFAAAFEKHGRNWAMVAQAVGTKSMPQVKNFYNNEYRKKYLKARAEKKLSRAESTGKAKQRDEDNSTPPPGQFDSVPETPVNEEMASHEPSASASSQLQQMQHAQLTQQLQHLHARQLQQHYQAGYDERPANRSGSTTPDAMDLWAKAQQQGMLQNNNNKNSNTGEEAARLLLQQHSQTQHQQQILSNLLPWVNANQHHSSTHASGNGLQDWNDTQQLQNLLQLQQHQQNHHNPLSTLHSMGLSGLAGLTGSNTITRLQQQPPPPPQQQHHHQPHHQPQQHQHQHHHQQQQQYHHQQQHQTQHIHQQHQHQQQHHHQQQQQQQPSADDAQLALAHLLNLQGQNGGSASDALTFLARGLSDRHNNNQGNGNGR